MPKVNRKIIVLMAIVVLSLALVAVALWLPRYGLLRQSREVGPFVATAKQLLAETPPKYAEALVPLKEALKQTSGKRADINYMLGDCYAHQRPDPDLKAATNYFKRAKETAASDDRDRPLYIRKLAEAYRDQGQIRLAVTEANDLVKVEPDKDENYLLQAQVNAIAGQFATAPTEKKEYAKQALAASDKAIAANPKNLTTYQLKVQLLLGLSEDPQAPAQAEATLQQAVAKVERKTDAQLALFRFYLNQAGQVAADPVRSDAQLEKARQACNAALAVDPGNITAMVGLGQVALMLSPNKRDLGLAEKQFQEAIKKAPTQDEGYVWLSQLQSLQGHFDEALKTIKTALAQSVPTAQLPSQSPQAAQREQLLLAGADLSLKKPDIETAEAYLAQAKVINPNEPAVFYLSGRVAFEKGNYAEAQKLLEQAATLIQKYGKSLGQSRSGLMANEGEYRFWLARAYENLKSFGPARVQLERALELTPADAEGLRMLIRFEQVKMALTLNEFDEAINLALKVREVITKEYNYFISYMLCQAYVGAGQLDKGLEVAKQLVADHPDQYGGYVFQAEIYNRQMLAEKAENRPMLAEKAEKALRDGLDQVKEAKDKQQAYETLLNFYRDRTPEKMVALLAQADADAALTAEQKNRLHFVAARTPEERRKLVEAQVQQHPNDPDWQARLGVLLLQDGHAEEGLKVLRQAYDVALAQKKNDLVSDIWQQVFSQLLTAENPKDVEDWIGKLPPDMARDKRMAEAMIELLRVTNPPAAEVQDKGPAKRVQVQVDHVNKAITQFQSLIGAAGVTEADVAVLRALGRAHFLKAALAPLEKAKELDEAAKYYGQVIDLQPQDLQSQLGLAAVYLQQGKFDRALPQAVDILARNPDNRSAQLSALMIKAQAQQSKALYAEAANTREQLRSLNPGHIENLMALAQLREVLGQDSAAEAVYREALKQADNVKQAGASEAARLAANPETAKQADALRQATAAQALQLAGEPTLRLALLLFARGGAAQKQADDLLLGFAETNTNPVTRAVLLSRYYGGTGRPDLSLEKVREAWTAAPTDTTVALFLSTQLMQQNKVGEAVTVLEQALKSAKDPQPVKLLLADVLMIEQRDLERARTLIEEVLKDEPNSLRAKMIRGRIVTRQAEKAAAENKSAEAERLFNLAESFLNEVVRQAPDLGEVQIALSDISLDRGDRVKAIEQLGKVGSSDPTYLQAQQRVIEADLQLGRREAARQALGKLLNVEPRDVQSRARLAELYMRESRFGDGEQVLREGLAGPTPDNVLLLKDLAQVLQGQGKTAEAVRTIDHVTQLAPEDPSAWEIWKNIQNTAGQQPAALAKLEQLAKSHPDGVQFQLIYVDQLCLLKRSDDASAFLRGLIVAHPQSAILYSKLCAVVLSQKPGPLDAATLGAALRIVDEGLAHLPDEASLLRNKMELYLQAGEWLAGEKAANALLAKYPRDVAAWITLSECQMALGRFDEAVLSATKAIDIDPRQFSALNGRAWARAELNQDLDKARKDIDAALLLSPGNPNLLDTSAWIYCRSGDWGAAINGLEQIMNLVKDNKIPDNPVYHYHLGLAYQQKAARKNLSDDDKKTAAKEARKHLEFYLQKKSTGKEAEEAQKALKALPVVQ